jgi:CBS domain-containing protein
MATLTVDEIMTRDVVQLQVDITLDEVARVMRDEDIGDVVVIDNDRLVGVVTDRDIVVRAVADGVAPDQATLGSVATRNPVTVRPDAPAQEAALLMREHAVRRLLVCDDAGLVGIVSLGDLAIDVDPGSVLGGISAAAPNN